MQVDLKWLSVVEDGDEAWGWNRALYAYLHPTDREVLYLGKAHGSTVRARWDAEDKMNFWSDLERERGLFEHRVLIAEISTQARLTRQLLADVESMLIFAIEPWGNISARGDRIDRPGLVVRNHGRHWPGPRVLRDTLEHVEFQ